MDEYLFLTLAKLKADRRKLEEEQRQQALREHPADAGPAKSERTSAAPNEFVPYLSWR